MIRILILSICSSFLFNNLHAQKFQNNKNDLKKLAKYMAGEFSSKQQSVQDSDFYHITLRMLPIWKNKDQGYYFYVEQAMASAQDRPYRQRVYHLHINNENQIVSQVFEIQNPERFINAWKNNTIEALKEFDLIDRQGCSIYLTKSDDGAFAGSTNDKDCSSTLRGASYATSEVVIEKKKLVSWDRGWDANDKQVWGAVKTGYIFLKEKKLKI